MAEKKPLDSGFKRGEKWVTIKEFSRHGKKKRKLALLSDLIIVVGESSSFQR